MKPSSKRAVFYAAFVALLVCAFPVTAFSQEVAMALLHPEVLGSPAAAAEPFRPTPPMEVAISKPLPEAHKFFDRQNKVIFVALAATSAADFAVTRANLQSGGQELNPITRMFGRSSAGLAANFAGETAGVMGLSYFLHKTGHHKLERLAPVANIGMSGFAVGFGLTH